MPVLSIRYDRLNSFLRRPLSRSQILELLPYIGLDIEDFDDEEVKVEYSPNRPDFGSPAGIAKALNYLNFELDARTEYILEDSGIQVNVDKNVENVRPYILALYAKLQFSESTLKELISFQEDLHNGIGRKRRKFAIGLHDMSKIIPPIYYATECGNFKFIPLNGSVPMTIEEILKQTEQGILYSNVLSSMDRFPILKDSMGQVLSFPPIINGNVTALTERTRTLFVDVTATDLASAEDALSLLATTLFDYGGTVYKVRVVRSDGSFYCPTLDSKKMILRIENIRRILGVPLGYNEAIKSLKRVNMKASRRGSQIEVQVPRYRVDVLHEVDLIEEVGYGYGYNRITPLPLRLPQQAKPLKTKRFYEDVRLCLIGLGFTEVMNFYMSNKILQSPFSQSLIEVESPKTREYDVLRSSILPQLLQVLSFNVHEQYPQKIFEIGRTFALKGDNGIEEDVKLAASISSSEITFTEIKSTAVSTLNYVGVKDFKMAPLSHEYFISGRCASIEGSRGRIGILGEVSPQYISQASLRNPVAALEIDLTKLLK
ncbi:MAG: phenylalanine--tRNA ligase subunit beta [Nitrososphaeria archaeon]